MASDFEIAQTAEIEPIAGIAGAMGLCEEDYDLFGKYQAKISLNVLQKFGNRPNGKYIVVTSITPTPLGEGRTTTSVGLGMALNRLGHRTAVTLRQPSLGPLFGTKGTAAGGGLAQIVPAEDVNLQLSRDSTAVALAHNLLAAFIDNSLFHDNPLGIDPYSINWPHVVDIHDRALRQVVIGLGGREGGMPRTSSFELTTTSEIMAVLGLSTSLRDLRERLGRIVIGTTRSGKAVTAEDLRCAGAMTALLKQALCPNLLQTLEHTPAFIHTDSPANIAHGSSSVLADQIALKLHDYVVTEAASGSELGMEKFFNCKCRYSGLIPSAVVLVATIRALKMHGGVGRIVGGKPLPPELEKENLSAVEKGCANLVKHIENVKLFGLPVVVAVNRYPTDTQREIALVEQAARAAGAEGAFVSEVWARGGGGAISLAQAVVHACRAPSPFKFLYALDLPMKAKIERIAEQIYGAGSVEYSTDAEQKIEQLTQLGFDKLPVCIAKTHLSLSHDERLKGRPQRFHFPIQDVRISAGAGFLVALCGKLPTMPALPRDPAAAGIEVDTEGNIIGLR